MDSDEHPLLQLSAEKQRDLANFVESDRIAEVAATTGRSRRQILGVLATLGAGAAVGGFTLEELVGVVEAEADTNDGDGNIGTPSNRVDLFADGVDATSVRTGKVNSTVYIEDGTDAQEIIDEAGPGTRFVFDGVIEREGISFPENCIITQESGVIRATGATGNMISPGSNTLVYGLEIDLAGINIDGILGDNVENVAIVNNEVYGGDTRRYPISLWGCDTGFVLNNYSHDHSTRGIEVGGGWDQTPSRNIVVSGNVVDGQTAGSESIKVRGSEDIVITGNIVETGDNAGIRMTHTDSGDRSTHSVVVTDNVVDNSASTSTSNAAIRVDHEDSNSAPNGPYHIANNLVEAGDAGIFARSRSGIFGNSIYGASTAGVRLQNDADGSVLRGNYVDEGSTYAVEIRDVSGVDVVGNVLSSGHNVVDANGTVPGVTVTHNQILDAGTGINERDAAEDWVVAWNYFDVTNEIAAAETGWTVDYNLPAQS